MSSGVREPIAAGTLYAADPQQLRAEIDAALIGAETDFAAPKLLMRPDCGLSAAPGVCGSAMLMLESERDHVERVVIVSDHHARVGDRSFVGIAVPRSIAFRTPLGDLLVDRDLLSLLDEHPGVVHNDRPFVGDHAIEVHLPPIQRLLGNVKVLPLLVGEATTADIVDVLERLWGDRSTLFVASGSFASGDDRDEVEELGRRGRDALRACDAPRLAAADVASPRTLAALATIMSRRSMGLDELSEAVIEDGWTPEAFTDVAAVAAWETSEVALAPADIAHLRALAISAIHLTVLGGSTSGVDAHRLPPALGARRATVVTLRREGQTRGSAGTIEADRTLAGSVVRNASAACADPRLPSVQPAELDSLDVTISVVSPIERVFPSTWDELRRCFEPGRHGVLMTTAEGRAAQLPAMWSRHSSAEHFIESVAHKASFDTSMKVTDAAWYRFETVDY